MADDCSTTGSVEPDTADDAATGTDSDHCAPAPAHDAPPAAHAAGADGHSEPGTGGASDAAVGAARTSEPAPVDHFKHMGLHADLLRGVFAYGFVEPTAIQAMAIVPVAQGRDVLGQAQSGTGKTGAFGIGLLQRIADARAGSGSSRSRAPQALVLNPVRELADQTQGVLQALGERMDVNVRAFVGGTSVREDEAALHRGVDVAVGTPGRLWQLAQRGSLDLSGLRVVVIDEADAMLRGGFEEQLQELFKCGVPREAQVCMFSATLPSEAMELAQAIMRPDPVVILVKQDELTLDGIAQFQVRVDGEEAKLAALMDLYERVAITKAVIFCNRRMTVDYVTEQLRARDFGVSSIHAAMDTKDRQDRLREFRQGASRVLVASGLIGRGIDVQQVSLVINYDVPNDREDYLHRIGRSGRHGRKGAAVTFVAPRDETGMEDLQSHYHTVVEHLPPDVGASLGASGALLEEAAAGGARG